MSQTAFSEDQAQFREVVSRFLANKSRPADVRRAMVSEAGYDPAVWRQLCGEVGLAGTHIPEAYGGFGFGIVELGIAAEEMGRHLYCGPFFGSAVMAGYALLLGAAEEHKERLLPGIADGSILAALVLDDLDSPERVGGRIAAGGRGSGMTLDGSAGAVVDAHLADLLIVIATGDAGPGLYAVKPGSPGVTVESRQAMDHTRRLSRVALHGAVADPIGAPGGIPIEALWDRLCVVLAHEMIGGAQALLESTVEYTKLRVQFGRPIGSFQALKHRCADLLLDVELARSAVHHAARCLAADTPGSAPDSAQAHVPNMAKSMANEAYMHAARTAVQLRGGIGFTWENDTHLWFKRAKSSEVFLGGTHWHRERMLSRIEEATYA